MYPKLTWVAEAVSEVRATEPVYIYPFDLSTDYPCVDE